MRSLLLAFALLVPALATAEPVPTFEQAFQREAAELRATKAALTRALDAQTREATVARAKLNAELRRVEASVLTLQEQVRALTEARDKAQDLSQLSEDQSSAFGTLIENAKTSLATHGVSIPLPEDDAARLTAVMDAGVKRLERSGRLHVERGRFFDAQGVQVEGELIRLGEVAAFGLAPESGGLLARSGSGFRVHDPATREDASKLRSGEAPEVVDLLLLSPDGEARAPGKADDLITTTNKGGPVAWVILGLAALGLLLILERLLTLTRLTGLFGPRFAKVAARLKARDYDAAARLAGRMGVVGAAIQLVIAHRDAPRETQERLLSEQVLRAMPKLERSLTLLVVLTAVAPLLGLLGTVTGMIATFDIITEFGTGDPKLLSGGISEALITTEYGLSVAVPLLFIRSLIARWSDHLAEDMQTYALATLNLLSQESGDDVP